MAYLLIVAALGLAQCAAAVAGLIQLGLHPMLAALAGGAMLVFASPLLALPGLYGAIAAWHWHWLGAFALFFPTLALMLPVTGFFSAWSLCQAIVKRRIGSRVPALRAHIALGAMLMLGIVAAALVITMPETIARGAWPVAGLEASSPVPEGAIQPSFDCRTASHPAEALVCEHRSLAELDRQVGALLASLAGKPGAANDWRADQLQWTRRVRDACATVDCLEMAYRSRVESLQIALRSAAGAGSAGRAGAAVAREDLVHLAERVTELTRNSGAQDYLFRLCGMTDQADELRRQVEETSALYYQYGKYVLDVELSPFEQAMDSFAAGQRAARAELVKDGATQRSACSEEVLRALRARYEVERNGGSYRAELYIVMAAAVADAKRSKEREHD